MLTHNFLRLGLRGILLLLTQEGHVASVIGRKEWATSWLHAVHALSILSSNLMVLHLLNYLLHVLTSVLELCKLLLEPYVEGLKTDDFLWMCHALDTSQKVVRHIVRSLKNVVLLQVNLAHAWVIDLIN